MKRITTSITLLLLTAVVGCGALETNEQACVRATTKATNCVSELLGDVTEDPSLQETVDLLLQAALQACANLPDTEDCNWRPMADCIGPLSCEQLIGGFGFGIVCGEFIDSTSGCQQ